MIDTATTARPYAQALFNLAKDSGEKSLNAWLSDVSALSIAVSDPIFAAFMSNPKSSYVEIESILLSCAKHIDEAELKRFLHLLIKNRRLAVLPEISAQYSDLLKLYKNEVTAHIDSAFPLSEQQVLEILPVLEKKFARKLVPTVHLNTSLIGGISVRVGDEVWDTSIKAQLESLQRNLT